MVALRAVGGQSFIAVALEAIAHVHGSLAAGGGVAAFALVFGGMNTVVKVGIGRERRASAPAQRVAGVGGKIGIGSHVQRQQPLILRQYMPVAVQARSSRGYAGMHAAIGTGVAGLAGHTHLICTCVRIVYKRHRLHRLVLTAQIGAAVEQSHYAAQSGCEPPEPHGAVTCHG